MRAVSRFRVLRRVPPASGGAVMATGILSVGLHLTGHETLSLVGLVLAAAAWVILAGACVIQLITAPTGWEAEADTPPALTAVAATCVLGTRLALLGWRPAAVGLLIVAAAVWPVLLPGVLRHLRGRMPGSVFLVCVATQALAVLSATLAAVLGGAGWLIWAALVFFALGLLLYGVALACFDFGQVVRGAGDHWVAGGALAISALVAAKLTAWQGFAGSWHQALRAVALLLVGCDLAWVLVLAGAEALRPRLRYDIRRWSTVFPLGMSAVACLTAAGAAGVAALSTVGQVLLWCGVAVWTATAAGAVRELAGTLRRPAPTRAANAPKRDNPDKRGESQ
ncbi:hypothetical protein BIV57_17160 [Mangrovactinospora gilvigrisea]|uniref:Integral membrane protein n=1 Tax=Mangrovactinospora gilvigrisea TaxID=1428644 RepID=A0A1J7C406_9ACTN|nr:tellurite resistance/C4-dicarboxylate transporter family protein [Mangrovactinospora gilvigrisea]OIV36300.1 hypothetical protein BIV57_17160 [Mangrovactinospora gilvigrisea]